MSNLTEIANKIKSSCESLPPKDQGQIDIILSNCFTFTEAASVLLKETEDESQKILTDIVDEFFVDINISCLLAIGQQYKSASVIARSAIELAIYFIYFVDHRVELGTWANAKSEDRKQDLSFQSTIELICNKEYMNIASRNDNSFDEINELKKNLLQSYRNLSERVHGKYKFLFKVETQDPSSFESFCQLTLEATAALSKLIAIRMSSFPSLNNLVPSMENIYG